MTTQEMYNWEEAPELNITPLVDVMLVLLAILMLSAQAIVYEEKISLPKGSKSEVAQDKPTSVEIRVDIEKKVYINEKIYNLLEFADSFGQLSSSMDKEQIVFIRADKNLKYDDVIYVLNCIKNSGFKKVSLVTDG